MKIDASMLTYELSAILKKNAPVRDGARYSGARGLSPYPGNLQQNGIQFVQTAQGSICEVGNPNAPYAAYTETRSKKIGWQSRSNLEFINRVKSLGLKVEQ